jgi:hypothetical protein
MEEPSVLDYLKARLMPWRGPLPRFPVPDQPGGDLMRAAGDSVSAAASITALSTAPAAAQPAVELPPVLPSAALLPFGGQPQVVAQPQVRAGAWPWLSLVSIGLALLAQITLEPSPDRAWLPGLILYLFALGCLVVASWRGEWVPAPQPEAEPRVDPMTVRALGLFAGIPLALLAFLSLSGNRLTSINLSLWLLATLSVIWAFWLPAGWVAGFSKKIRSLFTTHEWHFTISRWTILVVAIVALVIFFRVYRLQQVPPEMVSDQAEKLLDVWDVMHGEPHIFFPRNTGREGLQMYLTAAIIQLFNTGYSYLSLKIGTVLAGLLTLPFLYLLGKELGSKRVGLLAVLFAGIAYWPNVISRVGLRFPLYMLFVAPTLYFLIRGLRRSNRNDFILSGLFLGMGLHGYTPIRILPVVILAAVGLYLIHRQSKGLRKQTLWCLGVLVLVAFMVFLPLFRYALENPEMFALRSFSRMGTVERPLPGPAGEIFFDNLLKATTMFAWDDGEIWVAAVTHSPALDIISAALFYMGCMLLLVRYLRQRHWLDLFLLLSVPLLMMPSILSLAFPAENPALNRMSGAVVPVFLIVAIALDGLMTTLETRLGQRAGVRLAWGLTLVFVVFASYQNFNLVFDQYAHVYRQSSWNTSEMGKVIRQFSSSVGSSETAWVLAFPHWVDTRLVGMNAGFPLKDYAIWPDQLPDTLPDRRSKLFLIRPDDTQGLQALQTLYPQGVLQEFASAVENHNFYMYFVPPQ